MLALFFGSSIAIFAALLAAEYATTGRESSAYYLIKGVSRLATLGILIAAGGGVLLVLYLLVWLAGILF